ncbi:MAG TPA: HU family DNA-binding protein [Acidimicrobiia bacterium]|nr:HU family DNA-binding protein [Acidimicrobiia bacterium]
MSKKIVNLENADRVGKGYLIDSVASLADVSRNDAELAVNAVIDSIVAALVSGANVSISNVGTLRVTETPATTRRNPATGERFPVDAKTRVRWTSAPALLEAVNGQSERTTLATKAPKSY